MKICCDQESAGDRLNNRYGHSMQSETMFDHKQDLLFDDFRSIVLTVGLTGSMAAKIVVLDQISSTSKLYLGLNTSWPHAIFDQDWIKVAKLTETIVKARCK
jgi:hypothetical protein